MVKRWPRVSGRQGTEQEDPPKSQFPNTASAGQGQLLMVITAHFQLRPGFVTSSLTDTVRPGPFRGQLWRVIGKGLCEACVGIQVHEILCSELHLLPVPGLQTVPWCGRPYSTGPTQILGFVAPQEPGFISVPPGGAIIIFIARIAPHARGGERLAGGRNRCYPGHGAYRGRGNAFNDQESRLPDFSASISAAGLPWGDSTSQPALGLRLGGSLHTPCAEWLWWVTGAGCWPPLATGAGKQPERWKLCRLELLLFVFMHS